MNFMERASFNRNTHQLHTPAHTHTHMNETLTDHAFFKVFVFFATFSFILYIDF